MRCGTPWRLAVLASLALLMSGQLCMLTTCVPRLTQLRGGAHECCRTAPATPAPARTGHMPCELRLHGTDAPALAAPTLGVSAHAAVPAIALNPPPAIAIPVAATAMGPPLPVHSPAPADLRAPPLA